jgi:hypothetical protein
MLKFKKIILKVGDDSLFLTKLSILVNGFHKYFTKNCTMQHSTAGSSKNDQKI